MKKIVLCLAVLSAFAVGCGDDDEDRLQADTGSPTGDAGDDTVGDGICELAQCPEPDMGIACCAPNGECGYDPSGVGLTCVANNNAGRVCELDECPLPSIGDRCCTPFASCGFDPFGTGLFCIANPPRVNEEPPDAGPVCDPEDCPTPDIGDACCLPNNKCGWDVLGVGFCFPPPLDVDAGALPPISTTPPDDPSVDGQCPSYLGALGPVWGCCSDFGVCGTFAGQCLLPVGTPLPVSTDEDAGAIPGILRCTPPEE